MCDMDTTVDRLVLLLLSPPRYLCMLQRFLGSLLVGLDFSSYEVMRVTLAVHEACANVIKHGYQGGIRDLVRSVSPGVSISCTDGVGDSVFQGHGADTLKRMAHAWWWVDQSQVGTT